MDPSLSMAGDRSVGVCVLWEEAQFLAKRNLRSHRIC